MRYLQVLDGRAGRAAADGPRAWTSVDVMSMYQGRAVLITDEGAELAVGADLRSRQDGLESWFGRLTVPGEHWEALKNKVSGCRLRLDTRKEGEFIRTQTNDRPRTPGSPFFYNIVGNGDAPF